jgi:hypothetical protein
VNMRLGDHPLRAAQAAGFAGGHFHMQQALCPESAPGLGGEDEVSFRKDCNSHQTTAGGGLRAHGGLQGPWPSHGS